MLTVLNFSPFCYHVDNTCNSVSNTPFPHDDLLRASSKGVGRRKINRNGIIAAQNCDDLDVPKVEMLYLYNTNVLI